MIYVIKRFLINLIEVLQGGQYFFSFMFCLCEIHTVQYCRVVIMICQSFAKGVQSDWLALAFD